MERQEIGSETHILVFPYPQQGHINPMIQFSKRLASKGCKVTLLTSTFVTKSMQSQAGSIKIQPISDGCEKAEKDETIDASFVRFKSVVTKSLAEFIEKQKSSDNPSKLLVYDSIMPWALDIAHKLGIYAAPFFTQSCGISNIYYHLNEGAFKIPIKAPTVLSVPAMPLLEINDIPSFAHDTESYPFITRLVLDQFSNFQQADWLLFNSYDALEDEVVKWMATQWPIKTIGPTIPSMYLDKRLADDKDYGLCLFQQNADTCTKWLDTKEVGSVVYVSFGSLATLGDEQMEELAWGLKSSNNYFLWVVRASEVNKLPPNFVGETSEKGLVVNWCPQLRVLAHPAVGCFMTHCGWNSTLEAMSLGVPLVAMPQWTDQPTNAKFITDVWKSGVRVTVDEKGIVRREEIELRIEEVMEGKRANELKRNAVRWKELAKEAVDEGGSSDKNIAEFIKFAKIVCA